MKISTLTASVVITALAWGIPVAEIFRDMLSIKALIVVTAAALGATACTIAIGLGIWQDRRNTHRLAVIEASLEEYRRELKDKVREMEYVFAIGAESTRITQADIAASQVPTGQDTGPFPSLRGWG